MSEPMQDFSLNRREFFKLVGGGIVVLFTMDGWELWGQRAPSYPTDINAYLKIGADGRVTLYSGKIEMGQGVVTSLAQTAAEELCVPLESIDIIMGDTDLCPYDQGTRGSLSTRFFGPAVQNAAAEARAILLMLASEQLKVPAEQLTAENGAIFVTADKEKKVTYAQLAGGNKITRKLTGKAQTKSASQFTLMGKPINRVDAAAKVTGEAKYAGDIREPGMLYAKILRPPAHGATLKTVDASAAEKIPGVIVVDQGADPDRLIAVLHENPETADKALESIKADFEIPEAAVDNTTIFDYLVKSLPQGLETDPRGNLSIGEKTAASVFENTYRTAYGAHAPIETHTALAKIEGGKVTVWISTQAPFMHREQIAQALGLTNENVRVITPFVGGGFGGKSRGRQALEAAKLAKITGKPVQVMFSRAEEFFFDSFRPAGVVKIKSGITNDGKICLWDYNVYSSGGRSSEQFYDVPNSLIRVYGQGMGAGSVHPFATGPWRAPGANVNCFGRESQIDIMAAKAKIDPLEFRLNNLDDTNHPRMRAVLKAAAERFGWKKAPAPSGRGFGIACGIDSETYVAEIVEIDINKTTGVVAVKRVVCAQDMGFVVNPEGATIQMEGCLTMGLGYVLSEDIDFQGGRIRTTNFDTYELPRFSQLPKIETILVKNDGLPPKGGGEPAIITLGGAIGNAIFDATGVRLYEFPMTPEKIKKALADHPPTG